jgi:hypothetical protein
MVGKTQPASAGFLLPASCGLFCVWLVEALILASFGRTGGGSNYATTQLCGHATTQKGVFQMFWLFST